LFTVAIEGLVLIHVPPVVGFKVVVVPMHIEVDPVYSTNGSACTTTLPDANDSHPVLVSIKVKNTVPGE
jgi:hypothetical protein